MKSSAVRSAPSSSGVTRQRLLAAAAPLFSANGARGPTIREIAAAAGINSQLIYYYFGDKDGLFLAVLQDAASRVDALLVRATRGYGSPSEQLSRFIQEWVKVTLGEAPAIRMLYRAMLDGDAAFAKKIQQHSSGHAKQIGSLIAQGIATGTFRAAIDPRRAVASLVGMVQYLALAEPILFASTKLKSDRPEHEAMARHTAELFLRGISRAS